MTEPNLMQRIGVTRGKLALIAVLAVMLITVIIVQLPDSSDTSELALRRPTPSNPQQSIQEESKLGGSRSSTTVAEQQPSPPPMWPELPLDRIIAFDPFAAPDWLTAARKERDQDGHLSEKTQRRARKAEVLELLRKQGTTIVVISSEEKRAVIGEQSVRIGDHLEGFQIIDITKQGVVLSEIEGQ